MLLFGIVVVFDSVSLLVVVDFLVGVVGGV